MLIPLELCRLIAYELQIQRSRQSLLSLCMTSRAMNGSVTPLLYRNVELPTNPSVQSFCRTIQDSGTKLGPLVQSLSIGSYSNYQCWYRLKLDISLAVSLGLALVSLPCLRELMVALDPAAFSACFDPILTTPPPFSLHKLVIPLMETSTFFGLLGSQSSIEELRVGSENNQFELSLALTLALDPEFLPNLTSITGPMVVLRAGVPRRPISEIMIVAESLHGADPSEFATVITSSNWEPVLSGSRVPITSIGFYQLPHSLDHWDLLLPALKKFGIDKSLERIRIIETLEVCLFTRCASYDAKHNTPEQPPITERSKQEALLHRVNQMKTLHGFDRLESIEYAEMHTNLPAADASLWLGSMKSVGAWKKCVPSLKQVRMYGVDLPWLEA